MTIADLMYKGRVICLSMTDTHIPVKKDGREITFDLEVMGNQNDGYYVEIVNYKEDEK